LCAFDDFKELVGRDLAAASDTMGSPRKEFGSGRFREKDDGSSCEPREEHRQRGERGCGRVVLVSNGAEADQMNRTALPTLRYEKNGTSEGRARLETELALGIVAGTVNAVALTEKTTKEKSLTHLWLVDVASLACRDELRKALETN